MLQNSTRISPNPLLLLWIFILTLLLFFFFLATTYASVVISLEKAKPFIRYTVYFLNLILGVALYLLPKALQCKFYFIRITNDGQFKIVEPLGGTSEVILKNQVRGFSKSSKDSSRRFVRIYFETRKSVTLLPYYWTLKKIESTLTEHNIPYLGEEKFHFDFWGRPVGEKF